MGSPAYESIDNSSLRALDLLHEDNFISAYATFNEAVWEPLMNQLDPEEVDDAGEIVNETMSELDGYAYFVGRVGLAISDEGYMMCENSREYYELLRTAPVGAVRGRAPAW
ncbi:hypothetical protein JKP88DRAFT_272909 [Tribonema minus]|uniref:Uncharacterized protein n=1 Tax=Tribonema minus TaxID=303371 RepID=A0A836CF68_9STRA|nr:hypothetical protein JKP88DRAFT_272909 [Tribonema minus]